MALVKHPVTVCCVFFWVGFVCAISFLEAWLKFRAPGVTLPVGLGIGRLVFGAMNKVEWVLALAISATIFLPKDRISNRKNAFFFVAAIILLLQTFWLLPALDARAELIIQRQSVPPANLHFYYVALEVTKVICLSVFGVSQFISAHFPK